MHKTTMARNWDAFPDHKRKEIKKVKLAVAVPTRLALKLLSRVRPHILGANCANVKSFTFFFFFKRYFWIWIAHSVMTRPFWQCADFIFLAQIAFRKCAAATAAGTEVIKTFSYKDEFLLSSVGVTCCYHPRHCCCCNYCCFFCDTCTGQLFIWPVPFNHLPILFWIVLFPSPS